MQRPNVRPPAPPSARRAERGFTMVEVLVALTILLLGIAGLLSMQMSAMRATSFSRHVTEASAMAEDKMELLRTIPATDLFCLTPAACTETLDERGQPDVDGMYTRVWTPSVDLVGTSIQVVVSWDEQGGERFNVSINALRN